MLIITGQLRSIKAQGTESRLDVVLHVTFVSRVRERGKIRSNRLFEPSIEELPNCWHLGDDGPACGFPRELYPPAVDDLPSSAVEVLALALP